MEEYQIRMGEEFKDLYNKTIKLSKYWKGHDDDSFQSNMMSDQYNYMLGYLETLVKRCADEGVELW